MKIFQWGERARERLQLFGVREEDQFNNKLKCNSCDGALLVKCDSSDVENES